MQSTSVPGLFIQYNVISDKDEKEIIAWLDTQEWSNTLSRRTQHYGYEYSYKGVSLTSTNPFVGPLVIIKDFLINNKIMNQVDQCIVNEYYKNQGITKHIDGKSRNTGNIFGPIIVSISLNDDTNIVFSKDNTKIEMYVPKKSLLVMTGDSRYLWTHEIPKRVTVTNDHIVIKKNDDYRRISLTFRSIQ